MPHIAYDFLALGAAACWAASSMLAVEPVRHLGSVAFTRWRMVLVAIMLWAMVAISGGWGTLSWDVAVPLAGSGLVGIFIGDTALFGATQRLGPRRTSVLFATHAALSAVLGYWVLGERMGTQALVGAALTVGGVMTAMGLGRHKDEQHAWEADHGSLTLGVLLGLVAALGQALGSLIAKPVMSGQSVDPLAASALRVSVAALAHCAVLWAGVSAARAQQPPTARIMGITALNGAIGMGLGMTCILSALQQGDVGTVAILSSVTPVLVLPLMWWRVGRAPALGAWLGAGLTVLGTGLILAR